MTIQFKVDELTRDTTDGFVTCAKWKATKTENGVSIENTFLQFFTKQEGVSITPYEQLTEEMVIGWVKAALGEEIVSSIEAELTAKLAEQSPPTATGTPWSN